MNSSRPSLTWSPQEDEGIRGPPPPYLPVPFLGGPLVRIEQLRVGVEIIRTGVQLFHATMIAMGHAALTQDGENIVTLGSNGNLVELSSEESVALVSDDG